jgi:hypothetical protein
LRPQIAGKQLSGLFGEIDENCTRLEHRDWLATVARLGVDNRRHAVVRGDVEELGLELIAGADVDRMDRVVESHLFEEHCDFMAFGVGSSRLDHCERLLFLCTLFASPLGVASSASGRQFHSRLRS